MGDKPNDENVRQEIKPATTYVGLPLPKTTVLCLPQSSASESSYPSQSFAPVQTAKSNTSVLKSQLLLTSMSAPSILADLSKLLRKYEIAKTKTERALKSDNHFSKEIDEFNPNASSSRSLTVLANTSGSGRYGAFSPYRDDPECQSSSGYQIKEVEDKGSSSRQKFKQLVATVLKSAIPENGEGKTMNQLGSERSPAVPTNSTERTKHEPFFVPISANEIPIAGRVGEYRKHGTTSYNGEKEATQLPQTNPPQEIMLQPSLLPSFEWHPKTNPSEPLTPVRNTPPPTYQETVLVSPGPACPLPDYASLVATFRNCTGKEPTVSHVRLGQPSAKTYPPTTRNVLLVPQSSSDDAITRDEHHEHFSDHQILALLACIMFWPIGLVAVYYANMANVLQAEGIHFKSMMYSKTALILSLVAFAVGTVIYLSFYLQRRGPIV